MTRSDDAGRLQRGRVRAVARVVVLGALCAAAVLAAGRVVEVRRFGWTDEAAAALVEQDVRADIAAAGLVLRDMALALDVPASLAAAAGNDADALRALFTGADRAVAEAGTEPVALTVYSAAGQPLAWSGRASELPADRLQAADERWFLAQGPLGLRLVHVRPVRATDGPRAVGAIAAERILADAEPDAADGSTDLVLATSRARLLVEPIATAVDGPNADGFVVDDPTGAPLFRASLPEGELAGARLAVRRLSRSLAWAVLVAALLLALGPVAELRRGAGMRESWAWTLLAAALIAAARGVARLAVAGTWAPDSVFSGASYASPLLGPLLASPADFLLTALAAGALLATVAGVRVPLGVVRAAARRRARLRGAGPDARFLATHLLAGALVVLVLLGHRLLVRDTVAHTALDLLHFSLHPWSAARLAVQVGLLAWHAAALAIGAGILRLAVVVGGRPARWRSLPRLAPALWLLPLLGAWAFSGESPVRALPTLVALTCAGAGAVVIRALAGRLRRGSQALQLVLPAAAIVVPALACYPVVFQAGRDAKARMVESRFAPQALDQRSTVQALLVSSLDEIDAFPGLASLTRNGAGPVEAGDRVDRAFQVWRSTGMAEYPLTSSVELYDRAGALVSRFALSLPDDLANQRWQEASCDWVLYEEVSPFFAEDRRVLHAGRAICEPGAAGPEPVGAVVVHAMLDYENLPFITSRSPYVELLRPADPLRGEGLSGRDVEYAFYGWSGTPLYSSADRAWNLVDAVFDRLVQSREPVWAVLPRGETRFEVYLASDRGGVHAVGYPVVSLPGHMMNLAEVVVLAIVTYLAVLTGLALAGASGGRTTSARALLRDVRASFYRKLLLAFVAASVVPVVALAVVTRNYMAGELRLAVEEEAVRTALAARRVVEDLVAPRAAAQSALVDDNLMVWVRRLIDQDVNIFADARLVATSERNLFASGLLPTRMPAEVYRALSLRNEMATVTTETIGRLEYMVAATPLRVQALPEATLVVPLTSRQQDIEEEIDTLDRRVLLAALLLIVASTGLGYSLAERIADPINRLTRATRRLARGELDARVALTSSDELRRLVEDFNVMARDLERQRRELERTNRLEAWAEMARQVAHEIKNPLTPIQLNAEHLRRLHADRGEPLGPVVQQCVQVILDQVGLLRRIASEFSSFASSPVVVPTAVETADLLRGVVEPYRVALHGRIAIDLELAPDLPPLSADRTLVTRALVNIVENALHAMPGTGTLRVQADRRDGAVHVRISDTGIGMDDAALARAFEPYFSTKTAGTGLGLPIARRNVELNGGTIAIASAPGVGTTLDITLPAAPVAVPAP